MTAPRETTSADEATGGTSITTPPLMDGTPTDTDINVSQTTEVKEEDPQLRTNPNPFPPRNQTIEGDARTTSTDPR